MEFQETIDYVIEHRDSVGVIRGAGDSWELYDREVDGSYISVVTQEGLEFLRSSGIETYGRSS